MLPKTMKTVLALLLAALFCSVAVAQAPAPAVTVAVIDPVVIAPGGQARLTVHLRVAKGLHINSNRPNDEMLLPTVAHFNPPQGIVIFGTTFPEGEEFSSPYLSQKLNVFSGDIDVHTTVKVAADTAPGTERIHGEFRYQACDNKQCFPPKIAPFDFDVKVERPKAKKSSVTPTSPHIQ
jgi:hypothetical protein